VPAFFARHRDLLLSLLLGTLLGVVSFATLDPSDALHWDNGAHNLPLSLEAHRQLRLGIMPAWNPFLWSGAPLLADPQAQSFYPPTHLAFWLTESGPAGMMRLAYSAHVALAASGMALLGLALGLSPGGAIFAGTFFATNPILQWLGTGFLNMFATVSWLPWILLAVHHGIVGSRPWRWLSAGSVLTALAWFAGYPQYWIYSAIVVVAVGAAIAPRATHPRRGLWLPAAMLGLGLMLAAPQWLPLVALWGSSQRSDPLALDEFIAGELDPRVLLSFFVPTPDGPFGNLIPAHMGVLTAAFVIVTLARPDALRLVLAAFGVLGVWIATGSAGGLALLLYQIPGLSLFRAVGKFLLWTIVSLALLAGLGLSDVVRENRRRDRILIVLAVLVASLILLVHPMDQPNYAGDRVQTAIVCASLVGAALFATILFRSPTWRLPFGLTTPDVVALATVLGTNAAIFAMYAGDNAMLMTRFRKAPTYLAGVTAPASGVATSGVVGDGWRTFWGIGPVAPANQYLGGALGAYWHAEMSTGYSAFVEAVYAETLAYDVAGRPLGAALHRPLARSNRVLDVLSNRYLLVSNTATVRSTFAAAAARRGHLGWLALDPDTALIVNDRALPRARSVPRVQTVDTREDAIRAVEHGTAEPARVAVVEARAGAENPRASERGDCKIVRSDPGPGAIELAVRCASPGGFVVLSERWDPGWTASVGGVEVPVERVYGLVLGLDLPKGIHTVRVRYRPPGLTMGLSVAAIALALLVAAWWLDDRRSRRDPATGS